MKEITTDDCKEFIVNFQKNNPDLERNRFGIINSTEDNDLDYLTDVLNKKNWKRIFKRKAEFFENIVYIDGNHINKYAEPQGTVDFDNIKCVRGFDMITADGQIAYLLLEMNDGTLHLGDYIGD